MNSTKPDSKVILFYFEGMRSHLLYKNILEQYPDIFDCVIKVPTIPHERSTGRKNIRRVLKVLFDSPGFFFMHLLVVKVFSWLCSLFRTSIKALCVKNEINHYSYKKIDKGLMTFIRSRKPVWIISSTPIILSKEFIDLPLHGVINFHEAPLPKYRGSASYFWFIVNNEQFSNTTVHYVSEGLDTGNIICEGPKVTVLQPTVFCVWLEMLLSHKKNWEYIIPYLINGEKIPSVEQSISNISAYSYPNKKGMEILKRKKIAFLSFDNIKFVIDTAINGLSNKI
jgi:hypothetical protein